MVRTVLRYGDPPLKLGALRPAFQSLKVIENDMDRSQKMNSKYSYILTVSNLEPIPRSAAISVEERQFFYPVFNAIVEGVTL